MKEVLALLIKMKAELSVVLQTKGSQLPLELWKDLAFISKFQDSAILKVEKCLKKVDT